MSIKNFVYRQIAQIRHGGPTVIARKLARPLIIFPYSLGILPVLLMRLIRPLILVRLGILPSGIIGPFAQCTEIYLCQRDAGINQPTVKFIDIWAMGTNISNRQLALMWRRTLRIWPYWIVKTIFSVNRIIPGGGAHEIPKNSGNDTYNLFDRISEHLKFNSNEESFGQAELRKWGVEKGAKFVCLLARDGAFKDKTSPGIDWSYHDYRNTDVNKYALVAEELAKRGFYVFRMGYIAKDSFTLQNPKVFDYAQNGMRSDFMDVYLGAKCEFSITMGSGWDAIPYIFRRPITWVNMLPFGGIYTFSPRYITITKRHWSRERQRELTLSEIFTEGVAFCASTSDYESRNVTLYENTAEEIRDVAFEMLERLNGTWQAQEGDQSLQNRFWDLFREHAITRFPRHDFYHGELNAYFGAAYLRENEWWLA